MQQWYIIDPAEHSQISKVHTCPFPVHLMTLSVVSFWVVFSFLVVQKIRHVLTDGTSDLMKHAITLRNILKQVGRILGGGG